MDSNRLMYGSIGAGTLVGILLLALFGWIPLFGWLLAGVAAGLASRGSGRGFVAGLLAGVVVTIVAVATVMFVPVSDINTLSGYIGNQYLNGTVFSSIYGIMGMATVPLLKKAAVDLILLPAIGGFIGGSILSNGYFVQEVEEEHEEEHQKAEPQKAQQTARIMDDEKEEVSS